MFDTTNLKPLWFGTLRTPGPSSISTSTYSYCTTGAVRGHGWPSFSSKIPSWIAVPANGEVLYVCVCVCAVWRITYFSRFCLLLIMPLSLVIFIPISTWYFCLQTPLLWSNQWIRKLQELLKPSTWRRPLPRLLLQLRKTLQFWKDYDICNYIKNLTWAWECCC